VFFGFRLNNFGGRGASRGVHPARSRAAARSARERTVQPGEPGLAGFVFKIQANMDPAHATGSPSCACVPAGTRVACACFTCVSARRCAVADCAPFMAAERAQAEEAYAGDIIGLHNHGTIKHRRHLHQGERLTFTGVPNFAPRYSAVRCSRTTEDEGAAEGPVAAVRGGATQLFRPLRDNDLILGAWGRCSSKWWVPAADEYGVQWVRSRPPSNTRAGSRAPMRASWRSSAAGRTSTWPSITAAHWCTRASRVNLELTLERWPGIIFRKTREHAAT